MNTSTPNTKSAAQIWSVGARPSASLRRTVTPPSSTTCSMLPASSPAIEATVAIGRRAPPNSRWYRPRRPRGAPSSSRCARGMSKLSDLPLQGAGIYNFGALQWRDISRSRPPSPSDADPCAASGLSLGDLNAARALGVTVRTQTPNPRACGQVGIIEAGSVVVLRVVLRDLVHHARPPRASHHTPPSSALQASGQPGTRRAGAGPHAVLVGVRRAVTQQARPVRVQSARPPPSPPSSPSLPACSRMKSPR